jgi:hypothetical protein
MVVGEAIVRATSGSGPVRAPAAFFRYTCGYSGNSNSRPNPDTLSNPAHHISPPLLVDAARRGNAALVEVEHEKRGDERWVRLRGPSTF